MTTMGVLGRTVLATTLGLVSACATGPDTSPAPEPRLSTEELLFLNRITWGVNASSARALAEVGRSRFLETQLDSNAGDALPAEAQAQIDAMTISQRPVAELAAELERRRREFQSLGDPQAKKAAQQAYQQELTRLGREAASRMLLRALYSRQQLREQMTWFWMNHFNVFQFKANVRALIADYEERAIRPHALGRFRDLLAATARHPAMLIYLDNARNAANRVNENYARELMELHTLGVGGGYTQRDVQELARILTGHSVNIVRERPYMFMPARHDYGDKEFLGRTIHGRGAAELDEALDLLARHPSTARFIARKLALYLVADEPPDALVERMAATFRSSDGDIAATLRTLLEAPEFTASLGKKFKDPLHYVISALRLAYDDKVIPNTAPVINALARVGEPLYARATPDGYPLTRVEWASAGQLATRFEIARAIGYNAPGAITFSPLYATLGEITRRSLEKASSPQEWNMLVLASPEFMHR